MILFSIFNNKNINKKLKIWARGPRGCDVARKATWQRHVDPRSAPTWREYILYIIIITYSKRGLQPRLEGEGINPLICRVLYTRHALLFFSVWD